MKTLLNFFLFPFALQVRPRLEAVEVRGHFGEKYEVTDAEVDDQMLIVTVKQRASRGRGMTLDFDDKLVKNLSWREVSA